MTQPKKSPGKKFRGAAEEGAGAGAPVSKRLGIYGTGDVRERALQHIGGAEGLRQIRRRPKPGRLNFSGRRTDGRRPAARPHTARGCGTGGDGTKK